MQFGHWVLQMNILLRQRVCSTLLQNTDLTREKLNQNRAKAAGGNGSG